MIKSIQFKSNQSINTASQAQSDRLCGLVVRIPGYTSRGPGSIPGATKFSWEVVGQEWGALNLVSTTEELLGRKISSFGP
jgi:hypothetical protein